MSFEMILRNYYQQGLLCQWRCSGMNDWRISCTLTFRAHVSGLKYGLNGGWWGSFQVKESVCVDYGKFESTLP